jgi:hypothetical protein
MHITHLHTALQVKNTNFAVALRGTASFDIFHNEQDKASSEVTMTDAVGLSR